MRTRAWCLIVMLACSAAIHPGGAVAQTAAGATAAQTPARGAFRINYLTGSSAYINAGTADSVQAGDSIQVVRDGEPIALMRVAFVSSQRAVCDTVWTKAALAVGDHFVLGNGRAAPRAVVGVSDGAAAPAADSSAALATPAPPRKRDPNAPRLRGRVGARWLSVDASGSSHFQQPALDVKLDATNAIAGHLDVSLDMRTRRTTRSFTGIADQTQFLARVHRAEVTVRSLDANRRATLGRQTSPTLAAISLFDGALFEWGNGRQSVGVFGGTQPAPVGLRLAKDIVESGVYAEWHQQPLATQRWSVSAGGVTSQDHGQPNRDFLFAQSWWFSKEFNASIAQEADVNRGWKRSAGEAALALTSTFATLRVPVREWLAFSGGYDSRRSVRLYRDRLTPETQFDDAYRQGAWYGAQSSIRSHVRLTLEGRNTAGGSSAHSWSSSGELYRFAPLHTTLRVRASQYSGSSLKSTLRSGSLGFDPLPLSHIELSGGVRSTDNPMLASADREYWQTIDCDVTLGHRWYVNGGWERDYGGSAGDTRQLQAGLSWRFFQ